MNRGNNRQGMRAMSDFVSIGARSGRGGGLELRDYVRLLRRSWPAVLAVTALFVGLAAAYLAITPKRYEAGAVLYVSVADATSVNDLSQGVGFATNVATTFSLVVDSPTVLGPAASELRPQRDVVELGGMITTAVPENTTLIDIVAGGNDPADAAAVANAVAASASRVLPGLEAPGEVGPRVRVQQIQDAVEPTVAVSPDTERVLAIGLIAGLCLGIGGAITAQSLDTRIRRADDVREHTDVQLLAILPQLNRTGRFGALLDRFGRRPRTGLPVRDEPVGSAGEAFRTLRTNLRFLEATERRSIVFTSVADDLEGAQVPANLAWSLAQAGRRVLLVDLDLRRAGIGEVLGVAGENGIADILSGRVDLTAAIMPTRHPRLQVVLAGDTLHSPSDLLSAPILTGVLRRMEHDYDYVVLHCPPLLTYTDAAVVSGVAGGTLVSVAIGHTRGHELEMALGALANVRVTPIGLVLTGARPGRGVTQALVSDPLDEPSASVDSTVRYRPAQR